MVLLTILKLGEQEAYGVTIAETIADVTGKRVAIGALYTTLARLEQKGFLYSRMGEATEERGGRAKKYYGIDIAGRKALSESDEVRNKLKATIVSYV